MPTIVDSLIVTLGLDPKDFTKQIATANQKTDQFSAAIKKLGLSEAKLTEQQKAGVEALRQSAVNAERAQKQMAAATKVGQQFWGVLEKGALSFGAALGLAGLAEMAKDAVQSNAAIQRLSNTLGMGARDADAWGKAIEQSVGGTAGEALGTVRNLNRMLQGLRFGQVPTQLIQAAAMVKSLTGVSVNLQNADGSVVSGSELIKQFTPAVRAMGQEQSDAVLGGLFDDGTMRFMGLSDKDQAAALAEARRNTPGGANPYGDAEKLRQETADLTQAFGSLKDTVLLLAAPALTAGIRALVSTLQFLRDPTGAAGDKRNADVQRADMKALGSASVAQEIVSHLPIPGDSQIPDTWWGRIATGLGIQVVKNPKPRAWKEADELDVAKHLLDAGMDPLDARNAILAAEAAGQSPSSLKAKAGSGPGGIDAILDGIRDRGEMSRSNAVSPKGARGRYQLMPGTASQYGVADPSDDAAARAGARKYLTDLYAHYGDWTKATAAYNWGQSNLDQDISAHGDNWRQFLPRETSSYLDRMAPVLAGAGAGTTIQMTNTGPVTINTKATDAAGIKRDWAHQWSMVAQGQRGPS